MQGTWVLPLVWEDSTCQGATKPLCQNYRACAGEPASHNHWSLHASSWCSATRSPRSEKPGHQDRVASTHSRQKKPARGNQDPVQPKKKQIIIFFKGKPTSHNCEGLLPDSEFYSTDQYVHLYASSELSWLLSLGSNFEMRKYNSATLFFFFKIILEPQLRPDAVKSK